MNLAILILAAGESNRMGTANKLLLPFKGSTLLEHIVKTVCSAVAKNVVVVTGYQQQQVRAVLAPYPVSVVYNPEYREGMAASIRHALRVAPDDAEAYMICLADLPLLAPETIRHLIETFAAQNTPSIVIPTYESRRGHPVIFHRSFRPDLMQLQGDTGARGVVLAHPEAVVEVPVYDPGVVLDVDTMESYQQMNGH